MKTILLLALTVVLAAPYPVSAAAETGKPNVVFILADDLGYAELGCYGQKKIRTPRIDALAAQGMRFTRAYSGNAVCAPSRCVLMTGKHPGHAAVRDNRAMQPEGQHPLPDAEVTLAEILKDAGYATGLFGKWGLGNMESTGNPLKQGFTRFFGYNCQSHAHSYYPATLWSDDKTVPLKNVPPIPGHAGLAPGADPKDPRSYDAFKGQDYAPDRIHEQALQFVRDHRDGPFFLYYPSVIPHVALHVPDEHLKPYLAENWVDPPFTREKGGYTPHFTPRAAYAAMISLLDRQVGEILDLLDELKLADNTIVVFSSDNGATHLNEEVDVQFFNSVGHLRGLKGSLYEGGVRVPLIARWPGKFKAGAVSDQVTGFEDWVPTLAELIGGGIKTPDGIDGVSLADVLVDGPAVLGKRAPARSFLYREFPGYGGQQALWLGQQWKGIRQKLMARGKGKAAPPAVVTELYNLETDESESNNVAGQFPDVVRQIETLMRKEHTPSEEFPIPAID